MHTPGQTVREQLAEALDDQRLAVEVFIVQMDKAMVGPSTYERGQKLAGLLGDLQRSLEESEPALARHRAEPDAAPKMLAALEIVRTRAKQREASKGIIWDAIAESAVTAAIKKARDG